MEITKLEWNTGEIAPSGYYVCCNCTGANPESIIMQDANERLPECPKCGYTIWRLVSVYRRKE